MIKKGKKVLVAMSGGVDSCMAATLLKKKGYDVVGVFMHFWKDHQKNTSIKYKELKNIGKKIGIAMIFIDARKEFKKKVVDYFLREYQGGRTPNPCIVCNQEMKFKILIEKMLELNANFIATGHYAKVKKNRNKNKPVYGLYQAKDKTKDQSYFLYTFNQKQLSRLLLPLGDYTKTMVKKMARALKLPVTQNKESQDVCFISKQVTAFLKKYLKIKPGLIFNEKGEMLGKHLGLPLYTLGQRKGLKIGGDGPYYVSQKDIAKNRLIVTNNPSEDSLQSRLVIVKNINWIASKLSKEGKILVKTRYRSPNFSAIIKLINGKKALIDFKEPQLAITPGQSAVFYDKKGKILGGGIIVNVKNNIK